MHHNIAFNTQWYRKSQKETEQDYVRSNSLEVINTSTVLSVDKNNLETDQIKTILIINKILILKMRERN